MANRTKFTSKKREEFLAVLSEGASVTAAAAKVGMSRRGMYDARDADEEFKKAWDDAVEQGTDLMEDEGHRRAIEGVKEPVYYQGAEVGYVRKYSDTLLIFFLKARRPDKYRERADITSGGKPLANPYMNLSDEQLREIARMMADDSSAPDET